MLALEPVRRRRRLAVFCRLPARTRGETDHPLGCHRPRIPEQLTASRPSCSGLVTGCCWDVAGRLGQGRRDHPPAAP